MKLMKPTQIKNLEMTTKDFNKLIGATKTSDEQLSVVL